jgi:hemerythrin-like domain-containing protein
MITPTPTTPSITQPLRDEHQELLPLIEQMRTAAEAVGEAPIEAVRERLDAVYEFLVDHLIPHAEAEDASLYPVVARLMGAPEATETMSREHIVVGRMTEELASLRSEVSALDTETIEKPQAADLRRVLYGLYTLVKTHFDNEESVYLPLLDTRLSPAEAKEMFESMGAAAKEAKHQH